MVALTVRSDSEIIQFSLEETFQVAKESSIETMIAKLKDWKLIKNRFMDFETFFFFNHENSKLI